MAIKPLTEEEGKTVAALLTGVWTTLKGDLGKVTADEAVDAMDNVELDCGDGKMISLNTKEIRSAVRTILAKMTTGAQLLVLYMFDNPGPHSVAELAANSKSDQLTVEALLHGLLKKEHVCRVGSKFQLVLSVWLKEVRRREESDAQRTIP